MFTEAETNFMTKLVRDHVSQNLEGIYDRAVCLSTLTKLGESVFGGGFTKGPRYPSADARLTKRITCKDEA